MRLQVEGLPIIKSNVLLIMWSCDVAWQKKCYISTSIRLVNIKPGTLVTYQVTGTFDHVATWCYVTKWKCYTSNPTRHISVNFKALILGRGAPTYQVTCFLDHVVTWRHTTKNVSRKDSHLLSRVSFDCVVREVLWLKITIHLHFHKTYDDQIWHIGN